MNKDITVSHMIDQEGHDEGTKAANTPVSTWIAEASQVSTHVHLQKTPIIQRTVNFIMAMNQKDIDTQVPVAQQIVKDIMKEVNRIESGTSYFSTKFKILMGILFNKLKRCVKKPGQSWNKWATEHFPDISERSREDYMFLARRNDCIPYDFLGMDRLLMLTRATENYDEKDKIGEFMRKHSITHDCGTKQSIKDFKHEIDTALNVERLGKLGITADQQNVKTLTRYHPTFDNKLLSMLEAVQNSGGVVDQCLDRLIANKGKDPQLFVNSKDPRDFNSMAVKLSQIIDTLISNQDAQEVIDVKIFEDIYLKLRKLKKVANIK